MSIRYPAPPDLCADRKQQAVYEAECETARRAQRTRFAVAPRCQVPTPDGRMLTAGQPIAASDLHGDSTPAWRLLERHVHSGRVLESDSVRE